MRKTIAIVGFVFVAALVALLAAWHFNEQAKERMIRQLAEFRQEIENFDRFYAVINRPFRDFRP